MVNPANCKGNDIFIATPPDEGLEMGIQVQRNGKVSNNWADGTAGVPGYYRAMADTEDVLTTPDGMETADVWRDVFVQDGKFIKWDLTQFGKRR